MKAEQDVMGNPTSIQNFFIMDDLGYDAPIWVKNKDIKFLFMNGRHITHFSF
jgi:hypothetical protein